MTMPPGSGCFSSEEVVSVCHSLQRIAEQAQDTEETSHVFHDIIIPRLLGLALQAALQGKPFNFSSSALAFSSQKRVVSYMHLYKE